MLDSHVESFSMMYKCSGDVLVLTPLFVLNEFLGLAMVAQEILTVLISTIN
jgi:hypothetical protein